VLVDQDRIAIAVDPGDGVGAGAIFVGFVGERDACGFEVGLNFSHVFGVLKRCRLAIPIGVKGEAILVAHPLEQADGGFAVAKDQLVLSHVIDLRGIAADGGRGLSSGDHSPELVLRLYRQSSNAEVKRQCLDPIDLMLAHGLGSMDEEFGKIER
jgi:hypothetical protein